MLNDNELPEDPKDFYLYNEVTLRDLSNRYGIKYNTLRNRCTREEWKKKREAIRKEIHERTRDKIIENISEERSDLLTPICQLSLEIQLMCLEAVKRCPDTLMPFTERGARNNRLTTIAFQYALDRVKDEGGQLPTVKEFIAVPDVKMEDI